MASFSMSTVPTATTKAISHRVKPHATKTHRFKVSCNPKDGNHKTLESSETPKHTQPETSSNMHNINRRKLLLGLAATANFTTLSSSFAGPDGESTGTVKNVEFPVKLNQTVKLLVKRPAANRTKEDKAKATEVLMVNGIRFDGEKFVKFDVFVNDKDNVPPTTAADSEFAGSFAQLPHNRSSEKMMMMSGARFGITELLEDLKAEDDEYVLVSLVPRTGCEDVTVNEIKIELVPID